MAFNRIMSSAQALGDLGRTLLNTALKIYPSEVGKWYKEGSNLFAKELLSRIVSNLSCCYAGLKLIEIICKDYGLSWDAVFPFHFDICVKYLEIAAKDYLLDGSTNNQSVVEQTFEVMARMKLDPKADYTFSDDGKALYIRLNHVYDLYTKYRKDYAIVGEVLTYAQFKKQLIHTDLFLQSNIQKRIGTENRKVWLIDYELLASRCDVSGFEVTEIVPL